MSAESSRLQPCRCAFSAARFPRFLTGEKKELPPYAIRLMRRLYGSSEWHLGPERSVLRANRAGERRGMRDQGVPEGLHRDLAACQQEHPHAVELAALGNVAERQVRELSGTRRCSVSRSEPDAARRAREVSERTAAVMWGFNRQVERMQ